jgi:hypothetical protein
MTALSRITDLGEGDCPEDDHKKYRTKFITGASTVFTNNLNQTIVTTVGEQNNKCDKKRSKATTGSATVFAENQPVHRINDTGTGHGGDTYKSITGSPNVFNDGA